jgi:hypothetical protein
VNRTRRLGAAGTAGLIATVLLAGCSAAGTGSAPAAFTAPAPVAVPVLTNVLQTPLPIAAYELTPTQLAEQQYAGLRLTQQCMRGFGVDYLPTLSRQQITQSVAITDEFDSRWYGISDPAAVRTSGYHLPTWVEGMQAPAKFPAVGGPLLIGSVKTYDNRPVPAGGCLAEASDQLARAGFGASTQASGGSGPETVIGGIQSSAFQSAQSDPRVLAAFKAWSGCMQTHGYHYGTPFDAGADPRWSTGSSAGAAEIRTAETDLGCKLKVNLLGIEFAVVSDYQNVGLAKNARALPGIRAEVAAESADLSRLLARVSTAD